MIKRSWWVDEEGVEHASRIAPTAGRQMRDKLRRYIRRRIDRRVHESIVRARIQSAVHIARREARRTALDEASIDELRRAIRRQQREHRQSRVLVGFTFLIGTVFVVIAYTIAVKKSKASDLDVVLIRSMVAMILAQAATLTFAGPLPTTKVLRWAVALAGLASIIAVVKWRTGWPPWAPLWESFGVAGAGVIFGATISALILRISPEERRNELELRIRSSSLSGDIHGSSPAE